MSDAAQNLDEVKTEEIAVEGSKPDYDELQKRLDSVLAKHNQLMDETKNAKREKARIEQEQAEKEKELAAKNGEFEKLWKTAAQEKEALLQQLKDIKNGSRQEKLSLASMKIATELADGDNADLLSEFVKKNLEKLADDDGSLGEDVVKAVASEFKNNPKFKALLRSSKASGGGAPGNTKPESIGSNAKQDLSPLERMNRARGIKE